MIISHAILSSNSFLLVDAISRRFHTRLINEMQGLFFLLPNLYSSTYANCIFFLGFPGTIFFIAELLFFSFSIDLFPILGFLLYFLLYFIMPILFFKAWMNVLFSFSRYSN
jgi:NADH:ubiquinone oxidoreductase subunit 4 (subunit M)